MRSAELPIETLIEYVFLFQKGNEAREEILVKQRNILIDRIKELN
jgi:hypothetical protein